MCLRSMERNFLLFQQSAGRKKSQKVYKIYLKQYNIFVIIHYPIPKLNIWNMLYLINYSWFRIIICLVIIYKIKLLGNYLQMPGIYLNETLYLCRTHWGNAIISRYVGITVLMVISARSFSNLKKFEAWKQ